MTRWPCATLLLCALSLLGPASASPDTAPPKPSAIQPQAPPPPPPPPAGGGVMGGVVGGVVGGSGKVVDFDFHQVKVTLQPPPPAYPPLAKIAKIQGTVVVEITIAPDGVPCQVRAIDGPVQLRSVSEAYALKWRFAPAVLNGVPQYARFRLRMPFRLRGSLVALLIANGVADPRGVRQLKQALESCLYEVTLLQDADRGTMDAALHRLRQQLESGAVGVFYFAGPTYHRAGANFLVPAGAQPQGDAFPDSQAVALGSLLAGPPSAAAPGLHGPAPRPIRAAVLVEPLPTAGPRPLAPGAEAGLIEQAAEPGTFLAFAQTPAAPAPPTPGSPFSEGIAEELCKPQPSSLESLFEAVRQRVRQRTDSRQTPWCTSALTRPIGFVH